MDYFLFKNIKSTFSGVSGYAILNPGWKHMARKLDTDTVLIFGKKNTASIIENNQEIIIKPGRFLLLPAARFHYGNKPINKNVAYYWIHFHQNSKPIQLEESFSRKILSNPHIAKQRLENAVLLPQYFDVPDPENISQFFHNILVENTQKSYSDIKYQNCIINLLITLTQTCISFYSKENDINIEKGVMPDTVNKIVMKIEENLSDPNCSVKYISSLLNLNEDYTGRVFKKLMNISIGNYIVKRRIELAKARLTESNDKLNIICEQCGFGSIRQFHSHFKEATGKTPGSFRSEYSRIYINGL
jgi:YesN/AraC family two-component response regulator